MRSRALVLVLLGERLGFGEEGLFPRSLYLSFSFFLLGVEQCSGRGYEYCMNLHKN